MLDAHERSKVMNLGAFSISLAVKDLAASRTFYEKFGFTAFAGDPSQNWLIVKNGTHVIGLAEHLHRRSRSAAHVEGQRRHAHE
jgi:predicted lactoylglutathione lyase